MKNKGITLVALVVTIVVLLILAGVTINMVLSNNGIFNTTKKATESYQMASERDYLEQNILSYKISAVTDDEEKNKLGTELSDRDSINNNQWAIIQMLNDGKLYGSGYKYVPKGTNIDAYRTTEYNWVINYDTGEIINIGKEKEDYIRMSYDSGLSVKDSLVLNINPLNMADEDSWGDNVEFCNANNSGKEESGYNGTEIKFDGVDDYLKLENIKIEESEGFTFEIYCKKQGNGSINALEKTVTDPNDNRYDKIAHRCFRTILSPNRYECCFSNLDSESDKKVHDGNNSHWLHFEEVKLDNDYNYISMTVNYSTNTVTIFSKGEEVAKTTCNHDYLVGETLLDSTIPFTIGLHVGGDGPVHTYSKFDLYSCRLYTRVLTDEEVEENFNETIGYHNYLVKQ